MQESPIHIVPAGLLTSIGPNPLLLAEFAAFVAFVLLWTIFWGRVFKRFFGVPVIAGQIIAGLFLGPTVLDITSWPIFAEQLRVVDNAGVTHQFVSSDLFAFFLLLISSSLTTAYLSWAGGRDTDLKDIWRYRVTVISASFLGTLASIFAVATTVYYGVAFLTTRDISTVQALGMGLVFSATSISIPAATLFAQDKMDLPSSKVTLATAAADDILTVIFLSLYFVLIRAGHWGEIPAIIPGYGDGFILSIVSMVAVLVIASLFGYFVMPAITSYFERTNRTYLIPAVAFVVILAYFAVAELANVMTGVAGAYFGGLFHRVGSTRRYAQHVISPFMNAVFLPLAFGTIGLQVNGRIIGWRLWLVVVAILGAAALAKMVGCWLATALANLMRGKAAHYWHAAESYLFGSIMVARAEVAITTAIVLYSANLISPYQYTLAILGIAFTTIAGPVLLQLGLAWLKPHELDEPDTFELRLGFFKTIGTPQLFAVIVNQLERAGLHTSSVAFSEGREVISLEEIGVRIALTPGKGIIMQGDRQQIERILRMVKEGIKGELDRLGMGARETA